VAMRASVMGIRHYDDDIRGENRKTEGVRHGHLASKKMATTVAYRGEGSSDSG
jgi:hypothetical protein